MLKFNQINFVPEIFAPLSARDMHIEGKDKTLFLIMSKKNAYPQYFYPCIALILGANIVPGSAISWHKQLSHHIGLTTFEPLVKKIKWYMGIYVIPFLVRTSRSFEST